ncbi:precorrin-6y C5,15-methyltransferase (decarboxylating) subunit CbiE [Enemella sp. A6]|uniref:precorrin-6y C5,15-methyltransferase (decarboxylating) subunit CbiE n=1 Tax=Enemella sp. A6 TaxID=3440152 RepID=UPI003EB6FC1F
MIEVVGVPAAGVTALPPDLRRIVDGAAVLVGSPRLLAAVAEHPADKVEWPRPLLPGLDELLAELSEGPQPVVVLATGDPLDHGIGATLIRRLGADRVRVHPVAGSVALARAAMGWSTRDVDVVSLLTSGPEAINRLLTPHRRILVLSPDESGPARVAEMLRADWPETRLTVLANLGAADEERIELSVDTAATTPVPRLHVIAVELPAGPTIGTTPGRPDETFDHDGQLTKRELRAIALAALRPAPGQVLWDLGAGAGSVAIEWALHDPRCTAHAVERHPERAARITANARSAGATGVRVVASDVASALTDLPTPDAVFLGGGITAEVIDRAWAALAPGGRIVAHTVTIDTERVVVEAHRRFGGELRRIMIERADPLGSYLAWRPARPVVEWSATRPAAPHRPAPEETT